MRTRTFGLNQCHFQILNQFWNIFHFYEILNRFEYHNFTSFLEQCSTKIRTNYECFSSFIFIDSALNGTIQERTLHTNYLKKNCADSYYNGTINATTLFNFLSLSLSHYLFLPDSLSPSLALFLTLTISLPLPPLLHSLPPTLFLPPLS